MLLLLLPPQQVALFVDMHGHSRKYGVFCYGCEKKKVLDSVPHVVGWPVPGSVGGLPGELVGWLSHQVETWTHCRVLRGGVGGWSSVVAGLCLVPSAAYLVSWSAGCHCMLIISPPYGAREGGGGGEMPEQCGQLVCAWFSWWLT
jgi:hypothetical protein